jgi:hypothetical protein
LAWLMRRIKSRISAVVFGLPGGRPGFHVQYKAKALRCQAMTVAGCTICRHRRQPDQNRDNRTHNTRSERLRRKRRGAFAWRTASWCRRARISVCSAARLRKLEAITAQRPTRTEFTMETTMISRMIANYAFADRTEYSVRTGRRIPRTPGIPFPFGRPLRREPGRRLHLVRLLSSLRLSPAYRSEK